MRFFRAALLASIPVVGLASTPLLERLERPAAPEHVAQMVAPPLAITGEPARVGVMEAALAGLEGDIALGMATCEDEVRSEGRNKRYNAGIRRTANPEHATASEALSAEQALLAELTAEAERVEAEISRLTLQAGEQQVTVDGLAARTGALQASWQEATERVDAVSLKVEKSAAAAEELRRRAAHREALVTEIAALQSRLPGLRAEAAAAADAAEGVDVAALESAAARAGAVVESRRGRVSDARQSVKQARRSGGDVEAAKSALQLAREQLRGAEGDLQAALDAVIHGESAVAAAEDAGRHVLHTQTALRRAQDELSVAPGHCSILAGEADKLPRLERKLGHREAEARMARIELERAEGLLEQQREQLAITTNALRAQGHARAAVDAGVAAQAEQVTAAEGALSEIPARLSRTVRRDLDYAVETWTRTCTVFARVSFEDASGRLQTERITGQASVTDAANAGYPEAGIAADPRAYTLDDTALIREADMALADDIRALLADNGLADGSDTGR